MKQNLNIKTIFWSSTLFFFVFNIVGIIIFRKNATLSINSLFATVVFILLLIQGIVAYSQKDERRFFASKYYTGRFYRYNRPTQQQLKDFYIKAILYFAILPFYLPLAVFSSNDSHSLWSIVLLFIHIFAIGGVDIRKMIIERKEEKRKESLLEKEKKEQEKREEMGYWK